MEIAKHNAFNRKRFFFSFCSYILYAYTIFCKTRGITPFLYSNRIAITPFLHSNWIEITPFLDSNSIFRLELDRYWKK